MLIHCDFHCHTKYSKDSLASPKKILDTCISKGIGRIAITDHDTIQGALEAQQIDPNRVIVGEEITTNQGELLALFIKEQVPPGLSVYQTIKLLQAQDAFISVSHPFDSYRKHWDYNTLRSMVADIDAIEIFNARCMQRDANELASEFAKQNNLPGTVGSDAHILVEIGRAYLELPEFDDKEGLCTTLSNGTVYTSSTGLWVHLFSRIAKLLKKNKYP
ncbi:MAG: PHP domain-containing protein [Anaerolineaceae bacterium]